MRAISFSKEAQKALKKLHKSTPKEAKSIARRIMQIREVGITPNCKQLQNSLPVLHRSRCGDYRIIYKLEEKELLVFFIGHRREVYSSIKDKSIN